MKGCPCIPQDHNGGYTLHTFSHRKIQNTRVKTSWKPNFYQKKFSLTYLGFSREIWWKWKKGISWSLKHPHQKFIRFSQGLRVNNTCNTQSKRTIKDFPSQVKGVKKIRAENESENLTDESEQWFPTKRNIYQNMCWIPYLEHWNFRASYTRITDNRKTHDYRNKLSGLFVRWIQGHTKGRNLLSRGIIERRITLII